MNNKKEFTNELNTGLWGKTSKSGNEYYAGTMSVEGVEYWVNLFENDKNGNAMAPDFRILLNPKEEQITSKDTGTGVEWDV